MDWPNFLTLLVALGGSVIGAYVGVKMTVTKLQTEMVAVQDEIKSLRESRHRHAGMIQEHEIRLDHLERVLKKE